MNIAKNKIHELLRPPQSNNYMIRRRQSLVAPVHWHYWSLFLHNAHVKGEITKMHTLKLKLKWIDEDML